jgi:hypothetical protein
VNLGVFQFVLIFVVKDDAILLNVGDYRRLPTGAFQESYQAVEDPVLYT